jgi:hypothetical protein
LKKRTKKLLVKLGVQYSSLLWLLQGDGMMRVWGFGWGVNLLFIFAP